MYQIAICDDESVELALLDSLLDTYRAEHAGSEFTVTRFESADELLCMVDEGEYAPDILFIDIYMPQKNGIEVSKQLRRMGSRCRIVFVTASADYALEAFSVDAVQYIVKPVLEDRLERILDRLLEELGKELKKFLMMQTDDGARRVSVQAIVCCEAQRKFQYMYLTDGGRLMLHMTMAGLEELLCAFPEFVRIGNSYIVNLEHIESLNRQELWTDGGKKIYLPRGAYQPLIEKYFAYYND